ncbi:MAG: putative type II secretion system protein F [Fimbriimonadaceae bacterium]|nr:putative type II secretion system protein F [Fimbriimonadaceae bacterium]
MHAFQYKGYDHDGNPVTGEMTAASVDEVERRMSNQQVTLVLVKPAKMGRSGSGSSSKSGGGGAGFGSKRKVSDAEGANILSNLSVMVAAGVPFVEALEAIESVSSREVIRSGIHGLKTQIVEGQSLSSALRSATSLFPEMVADMVRVAEEGASLSSSLAGAAAYLARGADLRRKVKNAMLYPMVMLSVSLLTVVVLVVFVMPKFSDVFLKMKVEIPVTTQLMLSLGDLIRGKPWLCLGSFIGIIVALRFAFQNQWVTGAVGKIALRTPGIGDLLTKVALARALQSISALLNGNVPLVQALEHGAKVAGNRHLSQAIEKSLQSVQEGSTLFDAFKEHKTFPPVVTQMVGVGERTGKLASMITACATQMETEADTRLKSLVAVLEPLMIVFMGLIVGTITVSIITPIYSAVQNLQ